MRLTNLHCRPLSRIVLPRTIPDRKNIRTVFFGTPEFVVSIPETLLKVSFNLSACVTTPDKPVGRKKVLTASPVKVWAQKNRILVINSPSIEVITQEIKKIKPTVGILACFGKIIPQSLIDIFPKGILVIHPSLLPKYRGASPVQATIALGEKEIGVSIIKMDEKMDHGPIISQFKEKLPSGATPDQLYPKLFAQAAEVLVTILPTYIKGQIELREQNHNQATFCKILKKEDGFIPPQVILSRQGYTLSCKVGPYKLKPTPENLERFIRAMTPWPGVWTLLRQGFGRQAKRLKILKAHLEKQPTSNSQQLKTKLVLDQIQLEGKKPVSWEEFKKGYPETNIFK